MREQGSKTHLLAALGDLQCLLHHAYSSRSILYFQMSLDHSAIPSTCTLHFQILAMIKDAEENKAAACRSSALTIWLLTIRFLLHIYCLSCVSLFFSSTIETAHRILHEINTPNPSYKKGQGSSMCEFQTQSGKWIKLYCWTIPCFLKFSVQI